MAGGWPRECFSLAATIGALTLVDLPPDGERIEVDTLLRQGGTITLHFNPGHDGATDEDGDMVQEPIPAGYIAIAREDGREVGHGEGDSVAEALLRLWRTPARLYSAEPPFPEGWGPQADPDLWSPAPWA